MAGSRTSIAIVGLGFVVARFALGGKTVTTLSTAFGVALVICGGELLALAFRYYLHIGEAINRRDFRWSPTIGIAVAALLELCAIIVCLLDSRDLMRAETAFLLPSPVALPSAHCSSERTLFCPYPGLVRLRRIHRRPH
jgi:uncharacterized membrane protein YidH (DUF202 family)